VEGDVAQQPLLGGGKLEGFPFIWYNNIADRFFGLVKIRSPSLDKYSNFSLTNDLYSCKINSLLLHKNVLRIIPKTAFAAATIFAHCLLDLRDLSTITPKSLSSSTALSL